MNALERTFRFLSPKWYCRWGLNRATRERSEKLKATQSLSKIERQNLINQLDGEIYEWADWLGEMEDKELVRRARRMDIYLDDIPLPKRDAEDREDPAYRTPSHFELGPWGNNRLRSESRAALTKAMHERLPTYRRERREIRQLWINFLAVLTGLIGAATVFVTVWKK